MTPHRIQRRRIKGWRMPENTVYVGRGSRWGNPYTVGKPAPNPTVAIHSKDGMLLVPAEKPRTVANRDDATRRFAYLLIEPFINRHNYPAYPTLAEVKAQLAGKNLACWCPLDTPCHADILLEIANGKELP